MTARTRSAPVIALVLALLALGGCLSLPTDGAVNEGLDGPPADGGLELAAVGPSEDAEPVAIVQGFVLAASAGVADEFRVAREFLTTAGSSQWNPNAGVTVYADSGALTYREDPDDPGLVTVEVEVTATVDETGVYSLAPPGTVREFTFELVQIVGDQWRISLLDGGVLMSSVTFGSQYREMSVYYLTTDASPRLVPEVRWVPRSGSDRAAVRALLAGPSEWLAPGVVTAFPEGTALDLDTVVVDEQVATVSLTTQFLEASASGRALALAQLEETLGQLPLIREVEVVVDESLVSDPGSAELTATPVPPREPVVVTPDGLAEVSGDEVVPLETSASTEGLTDLALPYEAGPMLALRDGTDLVALEGSEVVSLHHVDDGRLLPPSYDAYGWAWTAPAGTDDDGTFTVLQPASGAVETVTAPDLAGEDLVALRVSREGARLAYAVRTDDSMTLYVAVIERDGEGVPTGIGPGQAVGTPMAIVRDLAWVDEVHLGVLGQSEDGIAIELVGVGGQVTPLPSVEGAVDLASGAGTREMYIGTDAGELYGRSGNGWRIVIGEGVSDPTFAG